MSILYSIPIHESYDCVKQMCDGILYYDKDAIIVIHITSEQSLDLFKSYDNRILLNPIQFRTKWGWDFTRVHVSNYLYAKNKFNISHIIFLTSNCLMVKNPSSFIKDYDCGFSESIDENSGWLDDVKNNTEYKNMLNELNSNKKFGCIIDGSYTNSDIMDKICYFYYKYFKDCYDKIHSLEEKIIPTISCNLTDKISNSLLHFVAIETGPDLNYFKYLQEKEDVFFIKKIPRDINIEVRQYYNKLIYSYEL